MVETTQFALDSLDGGYAALLSAIQAETETHVNHTPTHSVVDASHDSNIKVVTGIVPDAARTGSLAAIARDQLGTGVYLDEFRSQTDYGRRGLPYVGMVGRAVFVATETLTANGVNDRFRIARNFNPFLTASKVIVWKDNIEQTGGGKDYTVSNGSGQSATNVMLDVKMASVPTGGTKIRIHAEINEPITAVRYARPERIQSTIGGTWTNQTYGSESGLDFKNAVSGAEEIAGLGGLPATGLAVFVIGKQIQFGGNTSTLNITLRDGTEAAPNYWFFDYPDNPATRYCGIVLSPTASDNADGTYDFTAGLTSDTQWQWLVDPGTSQEAELTQAASLAACQATEGTYFSAAYGTGGNVTVHLAGGADPTNRVMQGGGGYRWNRGAATRIWNRFVNERVRIVNDNETGGPPESHVMFLGTDRKYSARGIHYLMKMDVRNNTATVTEGAGSEYHCFDVYVQDAVLARGASAIYLIGRGSAQEQFRDICFVNVSASDIGGFNLLETHADGHGIGIQGVDNLIIAGYAGRNNGGDINIYNINGQTCVKCKGTDISVNGTAEFFNDGGAQNNDIGIIVGGDGISSDDKSGGEFIRVKVRNKNTQIHDSWEEDTVWGDPLTPGDIDLDFTGTPRSWQTLKYGFRPERSSAGPISVLTTIRNLRAGVGLNQWVHLLTNGVAGTDWIYDGDDAVFVGDASDAKFSSTANGTQTLAQWKTNTDTGSTWDDNSVIEAP